MENRNYWENPSTEAARRHGITALQKLGVAARSHTTVGRTTLCLTRAERESLQWFVEEVNSIVQSTLPDAPENFELIELSSDEETLEIVQSNSAMKKQIAENEWPKVFLHKMNQADIIKEQLKLCPAPDLSQDVFLDSEPDSECSSTIPELPLEVEIIEDA